MEQRPIIEEICIIEDLAQMLVRNTQSIVRTLGGEGEVNPMKEPDDRQEPTVLRNLGKDRELLENALGNCKRAMQILTGQPDAPSNGDTIRGR